ncbi:hypothetical protein [Escherichia coli]|uniref:hypothetical protein n=1 Tax=Escherichia coli TaxID=562 RepID=UPI001F0E5A26|nr:hypothetical protein [Escherichia coli]UMR98587.1 hypothetical protein AOY87_10075 [Escherichia coli]
MFDLIKHLVKNDIQHTVSDNENITVTHNLDLEDVRGVDALPDNLTVGGSLYLEPKKITNVSFRENCGYSGRTIFAMWNGKEFRIAAGCFFGTIDEFEQAVDDRYDGAAAEAYKQAGRDCVAELTEKLNQKSEE